MARLPYLEADQVAPEYRDMLKRNTNLHKLLVNSPDMARAFNGVGGYIRFQSKLDPRLRELAILQVGWIAQPHQIEAEVELKTEPGEQRAARRERERENRVFTPARLDRWLLFHPSRRL